MKMTINADLFVENGEQPPPVAERARLRVPEGKLFFGGGEIAPRVAGRDLVRKPRHVDRIGRLLGAGLAFAEYFVHTIPPYRFVRSVYQSFSCL